MIPDPTSLILEACGSVEERWQILRDVLGRLSGGASVPSASDRGTAADTTRTPGGGTAASNAGPSYRSDVVH